MPFTGRDDEIRFLMNAYERVLTERNPLLVIVRGEAGSGKNRLFHEWSILLNRRPETVWIRVGRCVSIGGVPFHPVREIMQRRYKTGSAGPESREERFLSAMMTDLRKLCGTTGPSSAPPRYTEIELENFAHILGIGIVGLEFPGARVKALEPRQFRDGLRIAFRLWLEALTKDGAMVLVIENMQWADEATLELLEGLMANAREPFGPLLVLCLTRDDGRMREWKPPGDRVLTVELKALSEAAVRNMARGLFNADKVDEALLKMVTEQSGGNPYYAEELIRHLVGSSLVKRIKEKDGRVSCGLSPGTLQTTIPNTLSGLLAARLDALGKSATEVTCAASVVGRNFWSRAVADILGGPVDEDLKTLSEGGLVNMCDVSGLPGETEYAFRQALMRDTAYERLTKKARKELHRLVAEWLKGHQEASTGALLAMEAAHREKAEEHAKAAEAWQKAGEMVMNLAPAEAEAHFASAIAAIRAMQDSGRKDAIPALLGKRAYALMVVGRLREAQTCLAEALSLSTDAVQRANLLEEEGNLLTSMGHVQDADGRYVAALAEVAGRRPITEASILLSRASLHDIALGRPTEGREMLEKAISLVAACPPESLAEADSLRNRANGSLAIHALCESRFDDAQRILTEVLVFFEKLGNRRGVAVTASNLGVAHLRSGDADKALEFARTALAIEEEIGDRMGVARTLRNIGDAYMEKGDSKEALSWYLRTVSQMEETGDLSGLAYVECALSGLYRENDDLPAALEHAERAASISQKTGNRMTLANAVLRTGEALFDKGEYDAATANIERALELTESTEEFAFRGGMGAALAMAQYHAGRLDDGVGQVTKALGEFEKVGAKHPTLIEVLCTASSLYLHKGEPAMALEHALRAKQTADAMGVVEFSVVSRLMLIEIALASAGMKKPGNECLAGLPEDPVKLAREAVEMFSTREDSDNSIQSRALLARALYAFAGKTGEALKESDTSLAMARRHGKPMALVPALTARAGVLSGAGRHDEAIATAREAVESSEKHPSIPNRIEALGTLARTLEAANAPDAVSIREKYESLARRHGFAVLY